MRGREEGRRTGGKGKRILLFLLFSFILFPLPSLAQNALVLIQPKDAGPHLESADYAYTRWVRWPVQEAATFSQILAMASGVDLQGEADDGGFAVFEGEKRRLRNGRSLRARGYFAARAANLRGTPTYVLRSTTGGVSSSLFLLAADGPDAAIEPHPYEASDIPPNALALFEARSWDEGVALSRRVSGRTLILEYPPEEGKAWSRYYPYGMWPGGLPVGESGVPGMVQAKEVLSLLLRPESFAWRPEEAGQGGEADRWLEHGAREGHLVLFFWFGLVTFVIAWGLAQVMNEDRGPFVSEMIVLAGLSPAALVLAGALAHKGGIGGWPLWIAVALVTLYGLASLGAFVARRIAPAAHPLWPVALLGLTTLVLFDPLWSDLSHRFGTLLLDVPPLALGALTGYAAAAMAFAPGRALGRALAVAAIVWGATGRPWWVEGHSALLVLPAVALAAAEGLVRPSVLLALAVLPSGLLRFARDGVVWSSEGLVRFADERDATNLWLSVRFFLSPLWVGTLCFVGSLGLVGNRFLAYRLGKLWRNDPRLRALPWTALATLALGITEPLALPGAPVIGLGALIAFAYDGLRANE